MTENENLSQGSMVVKIDHSFVETQERERADKERQEKEKAQRELAELKAQRLAEKKALLPSEFQEMVKDDTTLEMAQKLAEQQKQSIPKKEPKGVVGLQNQAGAQPLTDSRKGYSDYNSMYCDIKSRELAGEPEAKEIMNALWSKYLNGVKEGTNSIGKLQGKLDVFAKEKSLADLQNEMYRATRKIRLGEN